MEAIKKKDDVTVSYLASVLRNLARQAEPLVENTAAANAEIQKIKDVFNAEWYFALTDFDRSSARSGATPDQIVKLQKAWATALQNAMARSFRKGYGSRGRQDASSLTYDKIVADAPIFKKILDKHTAFANQFAQEYSTGYTDRRGAMGVGARSNMYAQALRGAFNAGAVHGSMRDDKIWWRLGVAEHCSDCIALAASGPYTMDTLPTVPGNGDTICKTNCACHLVFVRGPKKMEPVNRLQSWMGAGEDGGVEENEETDSNVRKLQDLMLQRSFLRRVSLGADNIADPDVARSDSEAKSISAQIDRIASVPTLSSAAAYNPSSIITRADISQQNIEQIFMAGIDGPSIFRADIDKALSVVDDTIKLFDKMPERSTRVPKMERDPDAVPKVGTFSTANLVADGAVKTFSVLRKALEILGSTEIFVEVGGLDDSMERVVGFSGVWLRGQKDEVDMLLSLLQDAEMEFAVGEVAFL